MTTWSELINLTFRDSGVLGVGQSLQAQDTTDAIQRFNMLLSQWSRRRWLVYHLVDHAVPQTGALFYTIGAGGDVNVPRPNSIESAFIRQTVQSTPNRVDYPLRLILSYEEYSRISLKNLNAGPAWALFYDSGYPLGKLYVWPLCSSQFELHIQVKDDLSQITSVAAEILLPPEYEMALYAVGMKMTRSAYRMPPDPEINGMAKAALETIRTSNLQLPTLGMPRPLQGRGGYNILSDSFGPSGR